jgi:hypothetical protein
VWSTGDRYSGDFVVRAFAAANVRYIHRQLDRSAIYGEALGIFTSGRARLLDSKRLVSQLAGLERKVTSTRDKIDSPVGQHEDCANAVCGSMVLANSKPRVVTTGCDTYTGYAGKGQQRAWERLMSEEKKSQIGGWP